MSNAMVEKIAKLEGRIEALERQMDRFVLGSGSHDVDNRSYILGKLTPKQHVSLQMLMKGCSNADIAKRFGVTENTAKVHVRGIAKKYGVSTRSQIVMAAFHEFDAINADQYKAVSNGLPKSWADEWLNKPIKDDPYKKVYREK